MKLIIAVFLNISFIFTGFICANSDGSRDNDPLPGNRPGNVSFTLSMNGGMLYYSENLYISSDSCIFQINDGGAVSKTRFMLSSTELDKLYEVFKDNDFENIETYSEKVYDRGGSSISISWGTGKRAAVSNSGMTFIDDSWRKEWKACEDALEKIAKEQLQKQLKGYEIILDSSLYGREIYLQINRDNIIPKSILMSENAQEMFIAKSVMLSPGKHRVSMSIGNQYANFVIDTDSTKSMRLFLVNDSLNTAFTR